MSYHSWFCLLVVLFTTISVVLAQITLEGGPQKTPKSITVPRRLDTFEPRQSDVNDYGDGRGAEKGHEDDGAARSKDGCLRMLHGAEENKFGRMSDDMMEATCAMYSQWGDNMVSLNPGRMSENQRAWLNTLGAHDRPGGQTALKSVRKEIRMLTDGERRAFQNAVRALKNSFVDGVSKYDLFVRIHQARNAPSAHFGPGFLGFHRELIFRFENALRQINPAVSLPYWDSNLDSHLGDDLAQVSVLWTEEFLGNGKGEVRTGPFVDWRLLYPVDGRVTLYRNLTVAPPNARTAPALMPDEAVVIINSALRMRELSWFVDVTFESHHGAVHNWVGGVMADLANSPSDPVFFLHHAFIDCLWEQMRSRQRARRPSVDPRFDYPNDSHALGVGLVQPDGSVLRSAPESPHFSLNAMHPFDSLRNIDGLSDRYLDEFYACAPSPRCSEDNPDCGSQYLFCDREAFRCAPRLTEGTDCSRFSRHSDPCHDSVCCDGRCRSGCNNRRGLLVGAAPKRSSPRADIADLRRTEFAGSGTRLPVDLHTPDFAQRRTSAFPERGTPDHRASDDVDRLTPDRVTGPDSNLLENRSPHIARRERAGENHASNSAEILPNFAGEDFPLNSRQKLPNAFSVVTQDRQDFVSRPTTNDFFPLDPDLFSNKISRYSSGRRTGSTSPRRRIGNTNLRQLGFRRKLAARQDPNWSSNYETSRIYQPISLIHGAKTVPDWNEQRLIGYKRVWSGNSP